VATNISIGYILKEVVVNSRVPIPRTNQKVPPHLPKGKKMGLSLPTTLSHGLSNFLVINYDIFLPNSFLC
jgi:hypothetical protein